MPSRLGVFYVVVVLFIVSRSASQSMLFCSVYDFAGNQDATAAGCYDPDDTSKADDEGEASRDDNSKADDEGDASMDDKTLRAMKMTLV